MSGSYALDTSNRRIFGVCAGLARWADVDPALVRVTAILLMLFLGPIALLAYILTAAIAANR